MKCSLLPIILIITTCSKAATAEEEPDLHCGIKPCFMDLLNFKDLSFINLLKKFHSAVYCIRECSPPPVHEFFQSVSYILTRKIPGYCSGDACIEINRFVGLGHCLQNRSWPLVQCATKLVHLAQLSLEPVQPHEHRNKTCDVVIAAVSCADRIIESCGPKPYTLVQELFEKVFQIAMNFFCRVRYQKDGHVIEITAPSTLPPVSTTPRIPSLLPPVAKGFISRRGGGGNAAPKIQLSMLNVLAVIVPTFITLWYR